MKHQVLVTYLKTVTTTRNYANMHMRATGKKIFSLIRSKLSCATVKSEKKRHCLLSILQPSFALTNPYPQLRRRI